MARRPRLRVVELPCPHCGQRQTIRLAPLVYIRLVRGHQEADILLSTDCGTCGQDVPVRAGDARRAA